MQTVFDHIRNSLLSKAGLEKPFLSSPEDFERYRKNQWSPQFEVWMRNRLCMGGFHYGPLGSPGKPLYNNIAGTIKRIGQYMSTGNVEYLVDAANLCMVEFVEGKHPNKHFSPANEDSSCVIDFKAPSTKSRSRIRQTENEQT